MSYPYSSASPCQAKLAASYQAALLAQSCVDTFNEEDLLEGKSWADRQGILTGDEGSVCRGITICEDNRATVFEYRRAGIEVLQKIATDSYKRKGIDAVVYGILDPTLGQRKYAVYVQDGFLHKVPEDRE